MKQLLSLFLTGLTFAAQAQKEIKLEDLSKHVGDSVTVRGKIFDVGYLSSARNTPTLIKLGAASPNQLLTIIIWGDVRKKLDYKPEEKPYSDGMARVSGKVELYKGKPQIVVYDPAQLTLTYDEEVPASQIPPIKKDL